MGANEKGHQVMKAASDLNKIDGIFGRIYNSLNKAIEAKLIGDRVDLQHL